MLAAYFDESCYREDYLAIGGVVSTSEKWAKFSERCEQLKLEYKIPFIHSVKLFNEQSKVYRHLTPQRRRELLDEFVMTIKDLANFAIVVTTSPRQYDSLTTKEWRSKECTSYAACFHWILAGLADHLCFNDLLPQTISIFLEDGHRHASEASKVIETFKNFSNVEIDSDIPVVRTLPDPLLRIAKHGLLSKEAAPPLWAADLISYCLMSQILKKGDSFASLIKDIETAIPILGICLGREEIEQMKTFSERHEEMRLETHESVKFFQQFGVKASKHPQGVRFDASSMTAEQKAMLDQALK